MQASLGIVFALGQAMIWASTTIILRSLSTQLDAFLVNGLRAACGLLIILPMLVLTGGYRDLQTLTLERAFFMIGSIAVGGVVGDFFYILSLKSLGVSRAFPITSSYPLFTLLLSVLFLGEQVDWPMIAGMVLVILGVYLVVRPRGHVVQSETAALPRAQVIKGALQAVLTATLWALATVLLSLGVQGINSFAANTVRIPAGVVISLVAARYRGPTGSVRSVTWRTARLILLGGILGWGIAGTLYLSAIQLIGPSKTATISATAPLFAVPLSMIFLHEKPTRYTLAGTVLTVLGVALVA